MRPFAKCCVIPARYAASMDSRVAEVVHRANGNALWIQPSGRHILPGVLEEIGPGLVFIIGSQPEARHYQVFHTAAPAKKIAGVMVAFPWDPAVDRVFIQPVVIVSIFLEQLSVRPQFGEV